MAMQGPHDRNHGRNGLVRRAGSVGSAALLMVFVVGAMLAVDAAPSLADGPTTFTNGASNTIPGSGDGSPTGSPASSYPSNIDVSGLSGNIANVTATFSNLSHTSASDIHAMLVGPTGANIELMADVGGGSSLVTASNATLTFDDAAAGSLPGSGAIATGTYKPTNDNPGTDSFPSPAPTPSSSTTLASAFNGTNPNGTWNLYVTDNATGDTGTMAGGWSVTITTTATAQPGTLSFSQPSYSGAEGDGSATIAVSRSGGSDGPVSVHFDTVAGGTSVEGTQYTAVSQLVFLADGQTSANVQVPVIDDNVVEGQNTTVNLALSAPTGGASLGASSAVLSIEDNDSPSNATPVTIPAVGTGSPAGSAANPYPDNIHIQGLSGPITRVNATLTGLSHTSPADLDVLLVGPQGQNVELLSDVGSAGPASDLNLTFSDQAEFAIPASGHLVNGNFKPSNDTTDGPDTFPAPAPAPSSATTMSTFNGTDANGTWSLYISDDAPGDVGSLASWSLAITTLPNTTAPTVAPTGVTAAPAAGSGKVTVSFTPIADSPPDNGGSSVTAYTATCSGGGPAKTATSSTLPFGTVTVGKLKPGHTYTCTAAAVNVHGVGPSSAPSAPVTLATAPTVAPTGVNVVALPSSGKVTVSYAPITDSPPDNGGLSIVKYTATCTGSGQPTEKLTSSVLPFGTMQMGGFTPGATYSCVVAAVNAVGTGPASSSSAPVTLPSAPTVAPTGVAATALAAAGKVNVTFTPIINAPPDNGGSGVTGYVVTCSASGEPTKTKSTNTSPFGSFTMANLVSGVAYTCTVSAMNAIGTGVASAPSAPVIPN
jgi:subtilisin-like proprotein convertase family protein